MDMLPATSYQLTRLFYKVGVFHKPNLVTPLITKLNLVLRYLMDEQMKASMDTIAAHIIHIDEIVQQEQYLADARYALVSEIGALKRAITETCEDSKLRSALLDIWYFGDIFVYEDDSPELHYINCVRQTLKELRL